MTKAFRSVLLFSLLCFLTLGVAWGQSNQNNPADSQFAQSFGVDSINLQNLSVNLNIPILQKPGAMPFSYSLAGISDCVVTGTAPNRFFYCGLGFRKVTSPGGNLNIRLSDIVATNGWTISGSSATATCSTDLGTKTTWTNLFVTAPDLSTYYLPSSATYVSESGGTACVSNLNAYTLQGGMHITTSNTAVTVAPPDGRVYTANSVADPFGNTISKSGSTYTDTLNNAAIAVSGGGLSAETDTYHDTGLTAQTISEVFSSQTIKTAFAAGCSGISDTSYTASVVSEIDYPDGNNLLLSYEAVTGGVTGRIGRITYRTGGTATYTYGAPVNCASLIPSTLSRATVDGTTTYTFAVINGAVSGTFGSTTTVLDPGNNKTVYTFMGTDSSGQALPAANTPLTLTEVQTWQNTNTVASPSYTLLSTTIYCYNGNVTACPTTQAAYPITEKDTYTAPGSKTTYSRTKYLYDTGCGGSCGLVTSIARYDFTAIGGGTPVETTTITYGSWNGTNCVAIGSGIINKPCDITTRDAANNALSESKFTYGTKGFMTSKYDWNGTAWITTNASANANGTPAWTQNALGTTTTYGYAATGSGGCNAMLPTATSTTIGTTAITSAATWDCNMGKLLSATDANNNTSSFTYDLLGRPLSQTDPTTYAVSENYSIGPTVLQVSDPYVTILNTVDGLGRPIRTQKTDGASYDTATTAYGFTAGTNPQFQVSSSQPCIVAINADCTLNHFGKLDPLGRYISSSTTSNETVAYSFNQNDASSTLSPFPSGEHNKTVQTEYDGLGRVISTCALQTTGGTACGQVDGNSGILTTFAYSSGPWSRTVTATRGSQVHTTVYDPLGRVTSVATPEAGTTTYVYDTATSTCGSGTAPGILVETIDNAGTHMCFGVDAIGRTFQAHDPTYSQGCHSWVFGDQYSGTPAVSNANLRVAEAYTDSNCSGTSKITNEYFSYDKDGRTTDLYETTPHSGGQYHTQASYAVNGALASISGVPGKSTYTIGLDSNGRPDTSTYGTTAVATNVNYNGAGQPTEIDYGTDNDLYPRDPNTGLMTGWTFTIGASNEAAILTWNPNRTLRKLAITDGFNSGGTQTCHYNPTDAAGSGYDDVGRLVGVNCGALWTQTYSYDQYNNFSKSGTTNWIPGYNSANNRIIGAGYDADGQVTNDLNNSYAWDGYHKMITANFGASLGSCGSAGVTCVTYDAFGRPAEKNVAGTITEMLYSPIGLTGIMSGQTTNNMRVPIPGGAIFGTSTDGNVVYRRDWVGSVRLAFTLGHAQTTDTAFSPYGEKYATFGTSRNLNFTGDYQDLYSGLFDTPNREFDVSSGSRWLSPDPARASWNAYSYPTNPNSMTDPSGLDGIDSVSPKRSVVGDVTQQVASYSYPVYSPWSVDPLNLMGQIPGVLTLQSSWTTSVDLGNGFVPLFSNYSYTMSNGTSVVDMSSGMPVGNGLSPIQTAPYILPRSNPKYQNRKPTLKIRRLPPAFLQIAVGYADEGDNIFIGADGIAKFVDGEGNLLATEEYWSGISEISDLSYATPEAAATGTIVETGGAAMLGGLMSGGAGIITGAGTNWVYSSLGPVFVPEHGTGVIPGPGGASSDW